MPRLNLPTTPPREISIDFAALCRVEESTGKPLTVLLTELPEYGKDGAKSGQLPMTLVVDVVRGVLDCSRAELAAIVAADQLVPCFHAATSALSEALGELAGGKTSSPPPAAAPSGA